MKTLINVTFLVVVVYIILTSGFEGLAAALTYMVTSFSDAVTPHVTEYLLDSTGQ